jgi:hypothetical protein
MALKYGKSQVCKKWVGRVRLRPIILKGSEVKYPDHIIDQSIHLGLGFVLESLALRDLAYSGSRDGGHTRVEADDLDLDHALVLGLILANLASAEALLVLDCDASGVWHGRGLLWFVCVCFVGVFYSGKFFISKTGQENMM